jgi:hypothetical protein
MIQRNDDSADTKANDAVGELFDLHAALRQCFLKRLASGEPVSAAESEVIRKYLADNDVKVPATQWQVPPVPALANLPFGPEDQPDYSEGETEPSANDSGPERTTATLPAGLKLPFGPEAQHGSVEPAPVAPVKAQLANVERQLAEMQRKLGDMERRDGPNKIGG